jgi:hypothetical protein
MPQLLLGWHRLEAQVRSDQSSISPIQGMVIEAQEGLQTFLGFVFAPIS